MRPETRAFLAEVRGAEDPTRDDARRVLSRLDEALGASPDLASGADTSSSTGVALGSVSGLKLVGALVGMSGGVVLAVALASRSSAPARAPARPAAGLSAVLSVTATPVEPSVSARTSPQLPRVSQPAASLPSRDARPPPPVASTSTHVSAAAVRAVSPSMRAELELLSEVHAALQRGDGASALRRLDAHVTTDRQLAAERRAARVLALCAVGRVEEARRASAAFVREHPASVQRGAVERSCAGEKLPARR
jgi:hypothetical protein